MQTAGPPQPPVHVAIRFKAFYAVLFGLLGLILVTAGCGSGSASTPAGTSSPSNSAFPAVSPTNAVVSPGATLQFTASFSNTAATSIVWSASSGTISSDGLFTAPNVSGTAAVSITAASAANPSKSTTVPVTVQSGAPLAIETSSLAVAVVGSPYSASLEVSGGRAPYKWTLASGSLPASLTLSSAGALTGTPSKSGTFYFVARVSDSINAQAAQNYSFTVAANSSGFDGPAQLPLVYIQSSLADTPAPGSTVLVTPGGNLQSALNAAECGQTIALQSGATFSGQFTVPALACDDAHWIIIRT
ncbi:MAG TPA: putative Ig domain-containing protein, partial [Candidatus Dormibacteraeota bacterium]|nr:putative Ig domain-containing protein [Candidatus Dormibacteraeota bacterium]